jgi:hypothetical protein
MKSLNPRIQLELAKLEPLDSKINEILIEWDPIGFKSMEGVEQSVFLEYLRYIPEIKRYLEQDWDIQELIEDLEQSRLGYLRSSEEKRNEVIKSLQSLMQ